MLKRISMSGVQHTSLSPETCRRCILPWIVACAAIAGCGRQPAQRDAGQDGSTSADQNVSTPAMPNVATPASAGPPPGEAAAKPSVAGTTAETGQKHDIIENSLRMKLVLIPAGQFIMGSPESEESRVAGESQHPVKIEKPFYMGVYEVTQEQYERVMGTNPAVQKLGSLPAANVPFKEALEFCRRLSELEGQTYRLPTESEWEYACRAGTTTVFHYGNELTYKLANFDSRSQYGTKESQPRPWMLMRGGSYAPNAFGLFDMHGNVWEWCLDQLPDSKNHILRGGGADIAGKFCRSALRWAHSSGWEWTGFRVVRSVQPEPGTVTIPITAPLDQANPYSKEELLTKLEEALKKPALPMLPPVLIFPAVDAEGKVRADGFALSWCAAYAAAYTPQRRMQFPFWSARRRLYAAGCLKPGALIDDKTIEISLAAVGAKQYVLPQITDDNGNLQVRFAVQKFGEKPGAAAKTSTFAKGQYGEISGRIARGVLEHLGVKLDDKEIGHVTAVQISSTEDAQKLSQMALHQDFGEKDREMSELLTRNPRCWPAWDLLIAESNAPDAALELLAKSTEGQKCDGLRLFKNARRKTSHDCLLEILDLAPKFSGDSDFYYVLGLTAKGLPETRLVDRTFDAWRKADPGYLGCMRRGELLIDWAWDARGGGWASEVTEQGWMLFHERLQLAQEELETALENNPLGWEAHSQLITIGMALGLPHETFVTQHFQASIALRPRDQYAYQQMFQALQPRWGGDRKELLEFARQCIETNYWDEGIPEIGRRAIEELTLRAGATAFQRSAYRNPELWATLTAYCDGAKTSGPPQYKKYALNLFAKYGAYGEHYDAVAEAYRQIEKEGIDDRVFWDNFTYGYLRDLVFSHTETGQAKVRASLRAALDVGDFDKADEWLKQVDTNSADAKQVADRCRSAIETGRRLHKDGSIELSGAQMHVLFDGIDNNWRVRGNSLTAQLAPKSNTLVLLPFGVLKAEISGSIRWTDYKPAWVAIHTHTRAMRDTITIFYDLTKFHLLLQRGGREIERDSVRNNSIDFRFVVDAKEDQFEPAAHVRWTAAAVEAVPSGIGFQAWAPDDHPANITLKDLRIKLLK